MAQRLNYLAVAPAGMKALGAVYGYVTQSGLPPTLIDLVYLRVSQINGCAYCIDLHSRDLLKASVPLEKLLLASAAEEAPALFSNEERAALRWAEAVTRVSESHVPDETFEEVRAIFSDKQLADLTIAIGLMNAYNRVAISFRATPPAALASAADERP